MPVVSKFEPPEPFPAPRVHSHKAISEMSETPQPHGPKILEQLWNKGSYSDLMIECEGRVFKVHKAVVCSASGFFKAADESQMKESETGVVRLEDFSAITIERVLSFVYTQDYTVNGGEIIKEADADEPVALERPSNPEEVGETKQAIAKMPTASINDILLAHLEVYRAADFLQIPGLMDSASEKYSRATRNEFKADGFLEVMAAVARAPGSANDTLRGTWKGVACSHIQELVIDCDEFMLKLAEREDLHELTVELLREIVETNFVTEARLEAYLQERNEKIRSQVNEAAKVARDLNRSRELTDKLTVAVESLPHLCPVCRRALPADLICKRKGRAGQGDYAIRCSNCSCDVLDPKHSKEGL